jgi:hypothetical protein
MSFIFQFTSPLLAILILCIKLSKLVLLSIVFRLFNVGSPTEEDDVDVDEDVDDPGIELAVVLT